MPQWITNIEDKITRLRRTKGHLTTIISCKKTGIFNNQQKNLKEKYYKKYGNTRLHTLNFKLTVLKHNLYATSVKLKYQRKRYNRKLINRKYSINSKANTAISNVTIFQQKIYQGKKVWRQFGKESVVEKQLLSTMRNGYSNWKVLTAATYHQNTMILIYRSSIR